MEDIPLYSIRTIKTYIEYLHKNHPGVNTDVLLEYAGISKYELEDDGHWLTQGQVDRFHEKMDALTGDPMIARNAGRYYFQAGSVAAIRQYMLSFVSPYMVFSAFEKLTSMFTRSTTFTVNRSGNNKIEVVVRPRAGVQEKKFQCENRMGNLEAIMKVYTGSFSSVEHPECIHKGDDCCRYIITLEKSYISWMILQRLLSILIVPAALAFFLLPATVWAVGFLFYISLFTGISFYIEHLNKKKLIARMENLGDSAERLLEQINKGYNNALLIQEIGQAISNVMDIDKLLGHIMDTLQRRLNFDRGAIMLSNPDKTRLIYKVGYGFTPEYQDYLKKIEFNLDKPVVKAPFSVSFKDRKPMLIDNVRDIEKDLSSRSLEFAKLMESEAFICVPIAYKDEPLGILIVDNIRSKRQLNQSDMSLLIGVANQVAISINNARSYQKVLESEERFRSLSENAPDIIFTLSEDAVITYINPVWERTLGHKKGQILGQSFLQFVKKESVDLYTTTFKKVWNDKKIVTNLEGSLLSENNFERYFSFNFAPNIGSSGKVTGIIGILKDITEQKHLEAQLRQAQKMEAIGTLAGGIAHDFNNILGAVMGYTEMAMIDLPPENHIHGYLEQVYRSSTRAKDLIKQILAFSRQTEQELKPLKVGPIIKEAVKLLRASIPATIEIKLNIQTRKDTILADPTQVHQVLMNLCTNAAHAMQNGGGILKIDLGFTEKIPSKAIGVREAKDGPYLELVVSDNGQGMDPDTMDRIFDPFFTTKKPGEGTGMGLSVVHGIIKSHHGAVMVESRRHVGTSFHVYFPLIGEYGDSGSLEIDNLMPVIGGAENILFVDDEPVLVQLGKEILERIGYKVVGRTSGLEALKLFRSQPEWFDIVITDLTMQNMTGIDLAKEMLQIRPDIPIVICTGFSKAITRSEARACGIRDVILKPIVTKEIAAIIRRELEKKENRASEGFI